MEDKGVLRAMARSGWGQGRAWAGVEGRQGATERLRGKATQAGPSLSEGQRAGRDPGAGEGRSGRLRRRLPLRAQGAGSGPRRTSGGGSASGLISSGRKSHFLGCVSDSLCISCAPVAGHLCWTRGLEGWGRGNGGGGGGGSRENLLSTRWLQEAFASNTDMGVG